MSRSSTHTPRQVKGIVQIDLVKFLRVQQRSAPLPRMSQAAEDLLSSHVIVSAWYSLGPYLEIIDVLDRVVLKGSEQAALEMGAVSGEKLMRTSYSSYIRSGEALECVMAMRHLWSGHYNFGAMTATLDAPGESVTFTLTDYEDISMAHALMTAGWGIAAARAAGAPRATLQVLERPWKGDSRFCYRISQR